jgi:hypothetical protein
MKLKADMQKKQEDCCLLVFLKKKNCRRIKVLLCFAVLCLGLFFLSLYLKSSFKLGPYEPSFFMIWGPCLIRVFFVFVLGASSNGLISLRARPTLLDLHFGIKKQ